MMHVWYCLYTIFSFTPFFEKPGNRNRSQGWMRPSDPFASSFPGFSFSSSFGFGNGFGSDPFGSNRYRKCFPDFWHHCNFTSRKFSGQKRINTIFLLFSSNQCYLSVTLDPYLSTYVHFILDACQSWFVTVTFFNFSLLALHRSKVSVMVVVVVEVVEVSHWIFLLIIQSTLS